MSEQNKESQPELRLINGGADVAPAVDPSLPHNWATDLATPAVNNAIKLVWSGAAVDQSQETEIGASVSKFVVARIGDNANSMIVSRLVGNMSAPPMDRVDFLSGHAALITDCLAAVRAGIDAANNGRAESLKFPKGSAAVADAKIAA